MWLDVEIRPIEEVDHPFSRHVLVKCEAEDRAVPFSHCNPVRRGDVLSREEVVCEYARDTKRAHHVTLLLCFIDRGASLLAALWVMQRRNRCIELCL
jgi:hypothetical protein